MSTGEAIAWRGVRRVHPGRRRQVEVVALDDLTLEATAGELLVLVGPSGSGKSTALRVLAGIEPVQGGTLHIGPRDVTATAPDARDVAMVFQDLALFPHLSVADNVLFGPSVRSMPAPERASRLQAVAEVLDIGDLLERRPAELSGGQRQRVALARAMVREPAAFLLDEPLSNLDARLRLDASTQIVALQRRLATTMVFVTHDQAEAMTMGDRIAVLRDGRLEQVGTPREVYDRPATTFVATFLGTPPMAMVAGDTPLARVGDGRTVGVRAEDLVLVTATQDDDTPDLGLIDPLPGEGAHRVADHHDGVEGRVVVRQDLGSEVVLQVQSDVGLLPVRCAASDGTSVGDGVRVAVRHPSRLHVFDDASGRRVEQVLR